MLAGVAGWGGLGMLKRLAGSFQRLISYLTRLSACPGVCRSRTPSGGEDKSSIHEAERVGRGCKWIATRWCREEL